MTEPIGDEELDVMRRRGGVYYSPDRVVALIARLDAAESKLAAAEAVIEALTNIRDMHAPIDVDPNCATYNIANDALAAYDRAHVEPNRHR